MIKLFIAELRRNWIQLLRYPGEVIGLVIITISIFYGLFLGARYVAGPSLQFGERLDTVVVGYLLWNLVGFIIVEIAGQLQLEIRTGTLEQLFLSPFGSPKIFLMRALSNLTLRLAITLVIALIIIALTGSTLQFPPLLLFPLGAVLLGAYGLAFTMAALALLLKRVDQLVSILLFGILFLMTATTETWSGFEGVRWLLPMTGGAGLMRDLMARGEMLNWLGLMLAWLNGSVYFAIGLQAFRWAEREVKRRGKLGGY